MPKRKQPSPVTLHTPIPSKFDLMAAILIYKAGYSERTFATVHEIEKGRPPTIGAGRPATVAACRQLLSGLTAGEQFNGFIDDRMLYIGRQVSAWWRPPQHTRVHMDCVDLDADGKQTAKHLGRVSGIVPLPGLVFALAAGEWYVFAVKGAARPTPRTPLHRAPFFNVYASGRICEGNIDRPAEVNTGTLAAFERAFFESRFTHPNVQKGSELTRFEGGPYALWRALLNVDWTPAPLERYFPDYALVPTKQTLAKTLKTLEEKSRD